jgi:hypothetical protein
MDFMNHPQHAVDLHLVTCCKIAKFAVTAKEDTAGMILCKHKGEPVIDGESRGLPNHRLCAENTLAGQFDDFQPAREEVLFSAPR